MTTEYDVGMTTEFPTLGAIQFPRSYTKGRKAGQPTVIFIHTTEGSEGRTSAEDGAANDKRRTDGTSTHFFVDQDSTVQCVPTTDEAHAAREHGNDVGIQIEVCGRAGQSAAQWQDAASQGAIRQAARVAVLLRKKYPGRFPLVNLTPAQLRTGGHGFAEHKDATLAWPSDKGTHTDPGPLFPWAELFALIRAAEKPSPATKEWFDMATQADLEKALTKVLATDKAPFVGRPGERIHAAKWADMTRDQKIDYLCEMIMGKADVTVTGRLDSLTELVEKMAAKVGVEVDTPTPGV